MAHHYLAYTAAISECLVFVLSDVEVSWVSLSYSTPPLVSLFALVDMLQSWYLLYPGFDILSLLVHSSLDLILCPIYQHLPWVLCSVLATPSTLENKAD